MDDQGLLREQLTIVCREIRWAMMASAPDDVRERALWGPPPAGWEQLRVTDVRGLVAKLDRLVKAVAEG